MTQSDPRIVGKHPRFMTPDGAEFSDWNAARKHLTRLDLVETIRTLAPLMTLKEAHALADGLLRGWRFSKRNTPTPVAAA